eukprot:TRINITY_DN9655_c0_g3_i1.p1 TRINITY_DN9655_c0_g3~~TRINITY_DN9655_c0_g3_i1.p1  ORF type:complete len:642 (+),score=45.13 TRINITY_DN9655_c0_g3_i1:67-1992(+)
MQPEHSYQIWLHSVHGISKRAPLAQDDLARASSPEARLSVLAEVATMWTDQLSACSRDDTGVELVLRGTSLQTRYPCGGTRSFLPILFSQIGFSVRTSSNGSSASTGIAGVIALGLPWPSDGGETASGEHRPCNLWLLVITCLNASSSSVESNGPDEKNVTMREAVTALVRCGAICNTFCGALFSDVSWTSAPFGKGSSAEVKLMRMRPLIGGGEQSEESTYAIKVWNERYANRELRLFNEVRRFVQVQGHPNIGNFIGLFRCSSLVETPSWLMIMEAYAAGDLQTAIRTRGAFSILDAVTCAIGLASALAHVHALDIIQRDVKLENVLLKHDQDVVLVDFGLAVHMSEREERMVIRGTPGSFAPETLFGQGSGKKSDVFGAGTVFYGLLGGILPFARPDHDSTIRANARAHVVFHEEQFENVSDDIREIVREMLSRYPRQRLSSRNAVNRLVQEKERLDATLPGVLGDASLELADHSMESSAGASAAENDPRAPDVVEASSSFYPESENLVGHDDAARLNEMPSSTSDDYRTSCRSERTFASKGEKLTSRLASTSSQAFAWARRQLIFRHSMRGRFGHGRDQTRISPMHDEETDARSDVFTSIVCGPESGTAQPGHLRLGRREAVQWLRQRVSGVHLSSF